MTKTILFILLNVVTLYAEQVTENEMQSIYKEALLFISVFGIMGVISYIYSNRHAKDYMNSDAEKQRKEREKREKVHKEERLEALSKIFNDGLITPQEFAILQDHYSVS